MITNAGHPRPSSPITRIRWEGQRIDAIDSGALPGLEMMSNLIQSVQSPEFRGITFHEVLTKTALNRVSKTSTMMPGEWTINPYRGCTHACAYCYARPTHEHLGLNLANDFDRQIVVKTNIADVLRNELAHKRSLPLRVAMGTNTDPYQRAEGRYKLMPGIIDALSGARVPFSILTKGTAIRRDIPDLVRASGIVNVEIGMSISVLDDQLQQSIEPGAPTTSARLSTLKALRDAGLPVTVFMAPIFPAITDSTSQIDQMVAALSEAGANHVIPYTLYLMGGVKELFFAWLHHERPDLVAHYRSIYSRDSRVLPDINNRILNQVNESLIKHGLPTPTRETEDKFALAGKAPAARISQPSLF